MNEKKTATTSNNNIIKSIRIMRIGLITLYEPHFVFLFKPLRYYTFSISFHRLPWPLDFYYQFTLNVIVIWLYFFNFVRSLCGFLLCVQSVHTKIVFFREIPDNMHNWNLREKKQVWYSCFCVVVVVLVAIGIFLFFSTRFRCSQSTT